MQINYQVARGDDKLRDMPVEVPFIDTGSHVSQDAEGRLFNVSF
jgi:hypothetical protein